MASDVSTVVVTGGCGFIGSHFVRFQLQRYPNARVINIDKLTYAADVNRLRDVKRDPRYRFVKADICDRKKVLKAIRGADYIVNFAAETHVDNSIKNPQPFIKTNILGTFNLLECARLVPGLKKYVQVSTDEVYGPILEGHFPEDAPIKPSNPYSAAKASADALAFSYHVTYRVPVAITRTTNNYGSGQFPEKVVPVFVKRALENKPLPVYGDGLHKRRWIHVEDHCNGIDMVMRKGVAGNIYHIAGDSEITNIDLARSILQCLGKPESLIQFIEDHDIRPGHDRRYSLDDSKIRKELGWTSSISFSEGLARAVASYVVEPKPHKANGGIAKKKTRLAALRS